MQCIVVSKLHCNVKDSRPYYITEFDIEGKRRDIVIISQNKAGTQRSDVLLPALHTLGFHQLDIDFFATSIVK